MMKLIHFWLKCCIWLDDEIVAFLVEMHMVGLMKIQTFLVENAYGWISFGSNALQLNDKISVFFS